MSKWAVAVLALPALLLSAAPAGAFDDDDGRPAEKALEWLADRGVIDGCDPPANSRACPDQMVTRVEAAKILVRLASVEGFMGDRPGQGDHFIDDDAVWSGAAQPFINHLADLEVVHGCDPPANRRFCPHDVLLRGQITKMVVRTFRLSAPADYPSPWRDTDGTFFEEAARVAAYHGLLDPSAGIFSGHQPVTRGEFARMVVALFAADLCRDDPFSAARVAGLEHDHPGISFGAYVYDFDTGCAYAMHPHSRLRAASLFKVMVMAGTFLEAQGEGRGLTRSEQVRLEEMITRSANEPVRDLWQSFGGAPWFSRQAAIFGLEETYVVGDHDLGWGHTTTSGYDQGQLLRQVLLGEKGRVEPVFRKEAFRLMTSVIPSQRWGVSAGVPSGWAVAHKNGFAGAIANSAGVVYDADLRPDYLLVVLSDGWPRWQEGVPAVERVATWVAATLAD